MREKLTEPQAERKKEDHLSPEQEIFRNRAVRKGAWVYAGFASVQKNQGAKKPLKSRLVPLLMPWFLILFAIPQTYSLTKGVVKNGY